MKNKEQAENLVPGRADSVRYLIPVTFKSSFSGKMNLLYGILTAFLILPAFLLPEDGTKGIVMKVFFVVFAVFIIGMWSYIGILKKGAVTLDSSGISLKMLWGNKEVRWADIVDIRMTSYKGNKNIVIASKQSISEERKNPSAAFMSGMYGGYGALMIPLSSFSKIDPVRMLDTLYDKVQEVNKDVPDPYSGQMGLNSGFESAVSSSYKSTPVALLFSLAVSLIMGVLYGLSVYYMERNFIGVPVLGAVFVILAYLKYCNSETENLAVRLLFGLICALQALAAPVVFLLMANQDMIDTFGLGYTLFASLSYMTTDFRTLFPYYLIAVVLFAFGVDRGKYSGGIKRYFNKQ